MNKILVWDLPLRVFHWSLVAAFVGAFLTAESERLRDVHIALGYTVLALLAFRLLWAFVGTRYARLSSFAFGPRPLLAYVKSLLNRKPLHYIGHNPAGSWAIYVLVLLGVAVGISGYAVTLAGQSDWLEELHEGLSNTMLALVIVHVVGVVATSFLHRENLARAMITGYKPGTPDAAISQSRRPIAAALVLGIGALWVAPLQAPLSTLAAQREATTQGRPHSHEYREHHPHLHGRES